jgi:hypothetical protein
MSSVERIAKLLNQAENAGTEAEADTFMQKAQTLATVHSIDLARARHATAEKERTTPVVRDIHIGTRGKRGLRTCADLFFGIADANDISCTIASDSTTVHAYGFAEDIDVAEALFGSLLTQMVTASESFKRSGQWRREVVERWECDDNGMWITVQHPLGWLTSRLNFQEAYAWRIRERLSAARDAEEQRQIEAEPASATALVLASKRQAVAEYFEPARACARGSYRGGTSGRVSELGWNAGYAAADDARLSAATAISGARVAINA